MHCEIFCKPMPDSFIQQSGVPAFNWPNKRLFEQKGRKLGTKTFEMGKL